jgi:hypothetical protein
MGKRHLNPKFSTNEMGFLCDERTMTSAAVEK